MEPERTETAPHPIKDAEPVKAPEPPHPHTEADGPMTADQNAKAGPTDSEPTPASTRGDGGGPKIDPNR